MKNRLIGLAVLCAAIPVTLLAQSSEKKTLVGVWDVKISAGGVALPPLLNLAIFGGDGSFTTALSTKLPPVPPFPGFADERSPGYGRWVQTGDREFKLTFYSILWKEGVVNGYQRVRSTMTLSDSGNEFTADKVQVDFLDTNWKVISSDIDEVTGTRLETP
jgi:hypothetical protein